MKRPVVTGIHVFRKYLERNPAEFHCPAGGDNDYFFVGECEKYPAGDLVENLPDCLTVSGLADRIRSFLHFSAPDEGPLADYETWMPDFMKGLASGIEKNRNPDSYEVQMDDVEADSGGETEAGTMQRDVVRAGVVSIPVTFSVSAKWLKILTEFKQQEKIAVGYFDTETLAAKMAERYVEGYKASLVKDTSRKGLWTVSFTLREF